jgi:group II intron reverse transcriptase/maturase
VRSDEWAQYHEVQAIKGQSGKFGKRAGKVIVLIWGDLSLRRERQPVWGHTAEVAGVSRSHSTAPVTREGLNIKRMRNLSIASTEPRKPKIAENREPTGGVEGEAGNKASGAEPAMGMNEGPSNEAGANLWEQIFKRENLFQALARVEANGGAPGIDGLTVEALSPYLKAHWLEIRAALDAERYRPQPVRRVILPKPDGGERLLGIPTVLDRLIQQAIAQVLTPLFDPQFSEHSYGFRPKRNAHQAIEAAQAYIQAGYDWTVDIDLEKFFDHVNHDALMARVGRVVTDRRVKRLIHLYLISGVMVEGVVMASEEGTPQGGPLSPLLSNIMLDDLDKELERRGHRFVRYADDCNIYVQSARAGERVMNSVKHFIEKKLKLKVNERKSAVARATKRKFLGYSFLKRNEKILRRIAERSVERLAEKVRHITRRTSAEALPSILERLNRLVNGWVGYYQLADTPSVFKELDEWLRHRLRQLLWKRWKRPKTRYREMVARGAPPTSAREAAGSGKGPWRLSASPPVQQALNNAYWRAQGLMGFSDRYQRLRST